MANIQQGMNQILGGIGQAIALNPSAREAATNRAKNKSITKQGETLAKAANEHFEQNSSKIAKKEAILEQANKDYAEEHKAGSTEIQKSLDNAAVEVGEDKELMAKLQEEAGDAKKEMTEKLNKKYKDKYGEVAVEYLGDIEAGRDVQSMLGELQENRLNAKPTGENINKLALQRKNAIKRAEDLYNARMLSQSYFAHNVFKKGGNIDTYDTRDK